MKDRTSSQKKNPFQMLCQKLKDMYRNDEKNFFRLCFFTGLAVQILCIAVLSTFISAGAS